MTILCKWWWEFFMCFNSKHCIGSLKSIQRLYLSIITKKTSINKNYIFWRHCSEQISWRILVYLAFILRIERIETRLEHNQITCVLIFSSAFLFMFIPYISFHCAFCLVCFHTLNCIWKKINKKKIKCEWLHSK